MLIEQKSVAILATLTFSASIAGCQEEPVAPNATGSPSLERTALVLPNERGNERAPQSDAASTPNRITEPLDIQAIEGQWKVHKVSGSDSLIAGAIAEIYKESIRWSYRPDGSKGLEQVCLQPVVSSLKTSAAIKALDRDLASLTAAKKGPIVSAPQQILCADGGDWGPDSGADFVLLADNQIAMRWQNGANILLKRMDRAEPKEPESREQYKADGYPEG